MKKGRVATQINFLCDNSILDDLSSLALAESGSFGLRVWRVDRTVLNRLHQSVQTPYGVVRIKEGRGVHGEILHAVPEFDDCRTAALQNNVTFNTVYEHAKINYLRRIDGWQEKDDQL